MLFVYITTMTLGDCWCHYGLRLLMFTQFKIKLNTNSLSTKDASFLPRLNLLFLIHLENENPQTGSHLQVLEEESVL